MGLYPQRNFVDTEMPNSHLNNLERLATMHLVPLFVDENVELIRSAQVKILLIKLHL
jgi:hypothetical protein